MKYRSQKEFLRYVRKMWKLVAWRHGNAIYGWKFSLGSWRSVGPVFWTGRNPTGAAFDVRERAEARLRTDERVGDKIRRHLQGQRGSDLSGAAATGRRRPSDLRPAV